MGVGTAPCLGLGVLGRMPGYRDAGAVSGPGLLPDLGHGRDSAASARQDRNAHRGGRADHGQRGDAYSFADSESRTRRHPGQHRSAGQRHQPDLRFRVADRQCGRRRPGHAQCQTQADGAVRADAADRAEHRFPRCVLRLLAGGHHQPDSQFRPAVTHRHSDRRRRRERQPGGGDEVGGAAAPGAGPGRLAHPAAR